MVHSSLFWRSVATIKRILICGLIVAFLFKDLVSFAQPAAASDTSTLSPQKGLREEEFKKRFYEGYLLLSHRAINKFISDYVASVGGFENVKKRYDDNLKIWIASIPAMFKSRGQFGHLGLGKHNGCPVIWMDADFLYDESRVLEVANGIPREDKKIATGHDLNEIGGWRKASEGLKVELGNLRERWQRGGVPGFDAKKTKDDMHAAAGDLEELFYKYRDMLDLGEIWKAYVDSGSVLDDDDEDFNISAMFNEDRKKLMIRSQLKTLAKARGAEGVRKKIALDLRLQDPQIIAQAIFEYLNITYQTEEARYDLDTVVYVNIYMKLIVELSADVAKEFFLCLEREYCRYRVSDHGKDILWFFWKHFNEVAAGDEKEWITIIFQLRDSPEISFGFVVNSNILPDIVARGFSLSESEEKSLRDVFSNDSLTEDDAINILRTQRDDGRLFIVLEALLKRFIDSCPLANDELGHARYRMEKMPTPFADRVKLMKVLEEVMDGTKNPFILRKAFQIYDFIRPKPEEDAARRARHFNIITTAIEGVEDVTMRCWLACINTPSYYTKSYDNATHAVISYLLKTLAGPEREKDRVMSRVNQECSMAYMRHTTAREIEILELIMNMPEEKFSPAACLKNIKENAELMKRARSPEGRGITAEDVFPEGVYSNKGFRLLVTFDILESVREGGYKFTSFFRGPDENHTKTLINMALDMKCRIGSNEETVLFERVNYESDDPALLHHWLRTELLHREHMAGLRREEERPLTLRIWSGYARSSEQQQLLPYIRNLSRSRGYDIDFGNTSDPEESIKTMVEFAKETKGNPDAVTILPYDHPYVTGHLEELKDAHVIFMNYSDRFKNPDSIFQIGGIIYTGIAYLNNDELAFANLYSLLTGKEMEVSQAIKMIKEDPIKLIFLLQPIRVEDPNDLKRLNDRIKTLLAAA
ncbi:MAG: hypothetical protein PHP46_02805 [Candidatus Omnitrophica bacterium]|nr:hypothetical protein [Candidatus Omnitrophota bacterium]